MIKLVKRLWLAILLITAASALLLISDFGQRKHAGQGRESYPSLAVMQIASTPLLDEHVAGVLARLEGEGYLAPDRSNLRVFNPQGDFATANTIAREIVNGPYEVVITSSTLALQTFSKANVNGVKRHVFGAVTDPYGAGVGINGPDPDQHPPHLVGIGSFQPVKHSFVLLRELNPGIEKVGVVWNPGEQCSEACTLLAREICGELGVELLEAVATNTSEVSDAARSLLAKEIEALWTGGDTVATGSASLLIKLASQSGVPVFTNSPSDVEMGALFGLGADYFTVGQYTADMVIRILEGTDPSTFRVENIVPEKFVLNREVLNSLEDPWKISPKIREMLDKEQQAPLAPEPGRSYRAGLVYYAPAPIFEQTVTGFKDRMAGFGLVPGENLILDIQHANTDMGMLSQVTAAVVQKRPDVLIPLSTPALGSALSQASGIDIVFGIVSAPMEAGAGNSFEDHLPNVTGVPFILPSEESFEWISRLLPGTKRMGTLFNPSETNSVKEVEDIKKILAGYNMDLIAVPVSTTSEVPENIQSLLAQEIDVVFAIGDNTVANGLPAIIKACTKKKIPVVADDGSLMGSGALFSCGPNPYNQGEAVAQLTARVLLGESPENIPFTPSKKNELTLDLEAMQRAGVEPPGELLARADIFLNFREANGSPGHLTLINLVENMPLEEAEEGVLKGLELSGFKQGRDYELKKYSAQGDLSQLTQIIDAVVRERPDLIVTVSTPALAAAVKKVTDIPLVFTVASDPVRIGLFKGGRQANVCGIHDDPPVAEVLEMARREDPFLKTVGVIYNASEINSMISVEKLREAGREQQVQVLEGTATSVNELGITTRSLIQRGAEALIISADNQASTGFPMIHEVAENSGVPIYVTDLALVKAGADGGVGDNYFDWGVESGRLAAKVLAGAVPADLPIRATSKQQRIEPDRKSSSGEKSAPYNLQMVLYSETEFAEQCRNGLIDGINRAGLREGKDYNLRIYNAQGDMSTLSSIMTNVKASRPDLLMVVSTPTLQAAIRQAGAETRIVFTGVGDGVRAGAGRSETDHMPNITGISTRSPFKGMARMINQTLPGLKKVGTLFTPAEINSVLYKDWFSQALSEYGIELVAIPVTSGADVSQAAIEMCSKDIQAVGQIVDNLTRPGFALIARKASERDLPVFIFDSDQMKDGSVLCLARDYYDAGLEAAQKAIRVLRGENPGEIPFNNTQSEKLIVNQDLADRYSLRIGEELLREAVIFQPSGDKE